MRRINHSVRSVFNSIWKDDILRYNYRCLLIIPVLCSLRHQKRVLVFGNGMNQTLFQNKGSSHVKGEWPPCVSLRTPAQKEFQQALKSTCYSRTSSSIRREPWPGLESPFRSRNYEQWLDGHTEYVCLRLTPEWGFTSERRTPFKALALVWKKPAFSSFSSAIKITPQSVGYRTLSPLGYFALSC